VGREEDKKASCSNPGGAANTGVKDEASFGEVPQRGVEKIKEKGS